MAVFVPVSSYITIAKVCQYLSARDISKQKGDVGGSLEDNYSRLLYVVRKGVEWAYLQNPNDESLNDTALYLYALCGRWVNEARLIIGSSGCVAPVISVNPSSQSINSGGNFTLTVVASGTNLAYQWYKNLVAIGGATNASYSVTGASGTDAGNYYVIITNECGMATSLTATITVNVVLQVEFWYGDTDPYPALSGGTDNLSYQLAVNITHNQPISINVPSAAVPNKYLVVKIPSGESTKTTWFNTVLNNGTIPDSVWYAYVNIGASNYIISRGQVTMDNTQPLIFS